MMMPMLSATMIPMMVLLIMMDNVDDVGYGVDDSAAQLDVGKLPEGGAR